MIGLLTQQVNDIIIMESGIQYNTILSSLIHTYTDYSINGVLNTKYQESRYM
jgi:hypothetical protein